VVLFITACDLKINEKTYLYASETPLDLNDEVLFILINKYCTNEE
jgi:hypothetical protein